MTGPTSPPSECGTSTTSSASPQRALDRVGVLLEPRARCPRTGSSGATTSWPRSRSGPIRRSQHQAPCQAPWISAKVLSGWAALGASAERDLVHLDAAPLPAPSLGRHRVERLVTATQVFLGLEEDDAEARAALAVDEQHHLRGTLESLRGVARGHVGLDLLPGGAKPLRVAALEPRYACVHEEQSGRLNGAAGSLGHRRDARGLGRSRPLRLRGAPFGRWSGAIPSGSTTRAARTTRSRSRC